MKHYRYFFLFILFISIKSYGYLPTVDRTIDSLKYILKISNGAERVDLLNKIAHYYSFSDKSQIKPYASEALKLAEKIKYLEGTGNALNNLGFGYYINNQLDSAKLYAQKALRFAGNNNLPPIEAKALNLFGLLEWKKGNLENALEKFNSSLEISKEHNLKEIEGKSLNFLGLVNHLMGRYSLAIEYFINSVKIFENNNDKLNAAITLNNLAKIYNEIGNFEKSIKYSDAALKYAEELHDQYSLGRALNNLGESYTGLSNYSKALEFLSKAKKLKTEIKDSVGLAYVLEDIADCYINLDNLKEAEKVLKNVLKIREKTDSPFSRINSLFKLAEVKLKTGKLTEAKRLIDKGMLLNPKEKSNEILLTGYKLLSRYYELKHDYKNAFKYNNIRDSLLHTIFNEQENKRIAELELKYDLEKKENKLLKGENELKELKLNYQSDMITLIVILTVLAVLLIVVLVLRIKANKRSNETLRQKNLQIEKVNKTLEEKNKLIMEHKEELAKMVNVLKKEVSERKKYEQELISAKNKAEEANRLKSEFLAGISHEIRTPVNTILSYVSLLKEDLGGNGEYADFFDPIQNGASRLIRTIDSILNMSQFQSGEFELFKEKFDLYNEVLVSLTKEFEPVAAKKNLKLTLSKSIDDTLIYGDQYTITQLFTNLVDNAIKYTNEGFVRVSLFDKNERYLYVSVEDSGIGIAEEFIPDLFEPFHQEEMGYSRAFDGNGLGLALVKKYVEVNKGKIEVFSEKGKGTKFVVALELANVNIPKMVKDS